MIDLHCHILPAIDDGATDLEMALEMARIAVADGIREIACSPHIYPGMYDNATQGIRAAVAALQTELDQRDIPLRFEESVFELMTAGYTVLITHPERLSWVEDHYAVFERISRRGAWMQITAGALTGRFGRRVKYWGERFVGDGHCMVLATDAHHPQRRPVEHDLVAAVVGDGDGCAGGGRDGRAGCSSRGGGALVLGPDR